MILEHDIFECHITVALPNSMERFESLAKDFGWKTSVIEGDPLLGKYGFLYFTSYDADFDFMVKRMDQMADLIRERNGEVLRKKIEKIVYDTKKKLIQPWDIK